MDMLRDMDWLPRSLRQRETDLTAAYAQLQGSLGCAPTDEQLAHAMGISVEELDTIAQDLAFQAMHSLDDAIVGARSSGGSQNLHGWDDTALVDSIPDPQAVSPEEHTERQAERDLLARAIEALPDAERTVVSLYYYEGLTLKEIGRVLGVTESRACQIHGKAILRMRAHITPMLAVPRPVGRADNPP
jgi:RNA polymerase sigma factor for flagellar operon FliA